MDTGYIVLGYGQTLADYLDIGQNTISNISYRKYIGNIEKLVLLSVADQISLLVQAKIFTWRIYWCTIPHPCWVQYRTPSIPKPMIPHLLSIFNNCNVRVSID